MHLRNDGARGRLGVASGLLFASLLVCQSACAAAISWLNTAGNTNFNAGTSWSGGVAPATADIATFAAAAVAQPNLSADISVLGLDFSTTTTSGYTLSATSPFVLTLLSTGSNAGAAAISGRNTSGTNTISAAINLGAATGSTQTFTQASGGILALSGVISGGGATNTLALASTGTYNISGPNTYTGTTSQNAASTIIVGNKAAFGTSTLLFSSTGGIVQAGTTLTGSNKLTNALKFATSANETISGSNAFEFGGTVDLNSALHTITNNNTGGTTFSGAISNDNATGLALIDGAAATLTLSGTNTYTGNTTLSGAGSVSVASIGNSGNSGNLGAGTAINIGSSSAAGTLVYTGTGETTSKVINLSGTTGGAVIDESGTTGTLKFSADVTVTGSGAKTLTLQGSTAGAGEISGKIIDGSSATALTKAGTGTWTLSGSDTYTGATTINGGTLAVSGSLGNTAVAVNTGTTLALSNGASIGGAVTLANAASTSLQLSSAASIGGLAGGGTTGGTVALSTYNLTDSQAGATTYTGAITGSGKLIKSGAGTLTLNRTTSYGSGFILRVNQGVADLNRGSSVALSGILDSAAVVELGGGTLQLSASSGANFALTLGALDTYANSTLAFNRLGASASNSPTETIPLNFRGDSILTLTFNSLITGGTTTFSGATNVLYANGGLNFDSPGSGSAVTISNAISQLGGTFSFTKGGTGTLNLVAANTFAGAFNANGGTTNLSASALGSVSSVAVATGSVVQSAATGLTDVINDTAAVTLTGGTLDLSGGTETVASLTGTTGTLIIGRYSTSSGGFTVGDSTASTSFAGVVQDGTATSGTTTFTKQGSGTLILSGANTYTGTSNINAGTIGIGVSNATTVSGALGTSANVVNLGNTTGTSADASLLTTGAFTFSNAITVRSGNAGVATIGGNSASTSTFSGAIGLSKDLTVTAVNGGTVNLTKSIVNTTGTNTVNITGAGTSNVVLNNATADQFAPTTFSVNNGKLSLGASNQIATATAVTANGGTFNIGAFSDTVGVVTLASGSITGTSGVLTGASYDVRSGSVSAILGGTGIALSKTTGGTVTLSGTNTYTGGTSISAGTLAVTNTSGSGTGSGAVSVGTATVNSGTLGGTGTISGAVTVATGGTITGGSLAQTSGTVGTLNLTNGLTINGSYVADVVAAGGSDRLAVTGTALTLTGTSVLKLIYTGTLSAAQYVLATYASLSGTFGSVTGVPDGYKVDYGTVTAGAVTLDAVPEPGTWLGGLLLLGTGVYSQRRRLAGLMRLAKII